MAFNQVNLNFRIRHQRTTSGQNKRWSYISTADNIATIVAANYFDPVAAQMTINDTIDIIGSNGTGVRKVTAVSPHVTVAALD